MCLIGRIVKSTTHVDYVCQIYGVGEITSPPSPEDHAFGTFVRISLAAGEGHLVGLVCDTVLMNPEFGHLGPRLSPIADLEVFSPDYLNERVVLVTVVAVGQVGAGGDVQQGIPLLAAALGAGVEKMSDEEVCSFHSSPAGEGLLLAYAPQLLASGEPLMSHLLLHVVDQLLSLVPGQSPQLAVLRRNLAWKTAVAPLD